MKPVLFDLFTFVFATILAVVFKFRVLACLIVFVYYPLRLAIVCFEYVMRLPESDEKKPQ